MSCLAVLSERPDFSAETYGFKHLLWVYSGRRGIHLWISDQHALDLSDDQRKALVTFMEVIKGSKEQAKKVNIRGGKDDADIHPSIRCVKRRNAPGLADPPVRLWTS